MRVEKLASTMLAYVKNNKNSHPVRFAAKRTHVAVDKVLRSNILERHHNN